MTRQTGIWRCAILIALLVAGLTGTSLQAQEGSRSAGTWEVLAGGQTGPGQFSAPVGVAVDDQGNVYVVELLNRRIQKLTLQSGA